MTGSIPEIGGWASLCYGLIAHLTEEGERSRDRLSR
jgi:hypothetical protein